MPEHKVFFALQPDAQAAQQIAGLTAEARRRHGLIGKPMSAERLHISLNFVGAFRGPPPRALIDKTKTVVAGLSGGRPFAVALNRLESWKGDPHPLVLAGEDGVIGVEELHADLHKALAIAGMAPRREPQITPHVTLLYDRREAPGGFVEPVSWKVREFVLLDTVVGEGRQEVLGRWPLA
jgi:2'-5' RNA ligase